MEVIKNSVHQPTRKLKVLRLNRYRVLLPFIVIIVINFRRGWEKLNDWIMNCDNDWTFEISQRILPDTKNPRTTYQFSLDIILNVSMKSDKCIIDFLKEGLCAIKSIFHARVTALASCFIPCQFPRNSVYTLLVSWPTQSYKLKIFVAGNQMNLWENTLPNFSRHNRLFCLLIV